MPLPAPVALITRFFTAPAAADPRERRHNRILFAVARPLLLGLLTMAAVFAALPLRPGNRGSLAALVVLLATLPIVGALALAHRGRARAGAMLMVVLGFVSAASAFMLFGGLTGPLGSVLILAVMCAGTLGGVRAAVIAGAATVVLATLELGLELRGVAVNLARGVSPVGAYVTTIAFLGLGASLLALYIHEITAAEETARQSAARAGLRAAAAGAGARLARWRRGGLAGDARREGESWSSRSRRRPCSRRSPS